MNHTQNYQLSQWVKPDKVQMEDFNADNAKIDAAIKAEVDARTALAGQVAKRGNCQIRIDSYVGTGEWVYGSGHPQSITYPKPPQLVILAADGNSPFTVVARGMTNGSPMGYSQSTRTEVSWNGNTLTWNSYHDVDSAFNVKDKTYFVIAFLAADQ